MQIIQSIQNRIYEIRGERVILDYDLAGLYEVETKIFNQAMKRNIKRFPKRLYVSAHPDRMEWTEDIDKFSRH
ncbi:MAG: ORF6N domain-containing protein [Agriterribacter sp.]